MQRQRVVVTGGAGFLGSHLCERLLESGADVVCLDNFFTGSRVNVAHLLANPQFEIVRHDVVEPILLEVDQIYNLACPASPVHYQYNPVKTIKTCILGTITCSAWPSESGRGCCRPRTSEVYGDPLVHPQPESLLGPRQPDRPARCYDEGKRVAETLIMDYHRAERRRRPHRAHLQHLRPAHAPRRRARGLATSSCRRCGTSRSRSTATAQQTRSFCYVDDLVDGIRAHDGPTEDAIGPVNIGNPGEFTILELAEKVMRVTGSKSKIVHQPLPQDDPVQRQPDISLARAKLGWEPRVPLEEGLRMTIDYFRRRLEKKASA